MLTEKGKAAALLIRVRESWDSLSDDQRAEVAALVVRLNQAMRRESVASTQHSHPLPPASRLSA
jgi:hypothetical protein